MCGNFMGRIFILKYEVIRKGKTARQNRPGDTFSGLHDEITKKVKREGHMLPQEHRIAGG
jgi:hypothetical protein